MRVEIGTIFLESNLAIGIWHILKIWHILGLRNFLVGIYPKEINGDVFVWVYMQRCSSPNDQSKPKIGNKVNVLVRDCHFSFITMSLFP